MTTGPSKASDRRDGDGDRGRRDRGTGSDGEHCRRDSATDQQALHDAQAEEHA
jgi:hypothetical protein